MNIKDADDIFNVNYFELLMILLTLDSTAYLLVIISGFLSVELNYRKIKGE